LKEYENAQVFYLWVVVVAFFDEEVEVVFFDEKVEVAFFNEDEVVGLALTTSLTAVFKVVTDEEVFLLLELVEATFLSTLTLAAAVPEVETSLAPLIPLDLTTEPTDFFM
jgi:hypothetical protein